MNVAHTFRRFLQKIARHRGYAIVPESRLYEWQHPLFSGWASPQVELPTSAREYLRSENPRLKELRARYAKCPSEVTTPAVWHAGYVSNEDLVHFRGDNAYVWQTGGGNMNPMGYALSYFYLKSIDKLDLFERLEEDGCFGNHVESIENRAVSRDLLDSIAEINFLERHLALSTRSKLNILDIGAGYGRLAHRMTRALPQISNYLCTDAIPESTFLCDYYLRFRSTADTAPARAVLLDEIEQTLSEQPIDIALNIHSFSECTVEAVEWWLSLLARHKVRHLMIVPNGNGPLHTNDGTDLAPIIHRHGYRLVVREPKFGDALVQQYGINPAHHHLFDRQD